MTQFSQEDIVAYLNQELPGFEPSLTGQDRLYGGAVLHVRTMQAFAAYTVVPTEASHLSLAVPDFGVQQWVDSLIQKTRLDLIDKLGLQKQINEEVQRRLQIERAALEKRAFEEAYQKAMRDALKPMSVRFVDLGAVPPPEDEEHDA